MASPTDLRGDALPQAIVADFTARWERLAERWARDGRLLGTLGPSGTSSDLAARVLAEQYGVRVRLFASFDAVLDALLDRAVDAVLVPSAYHEITRFHWHPGLKLLTFFAQATPDYGIAVRDAEGQRPGALRLASMWEVRFIVDELALPGLDSERIEWVDAGSTQHAAQLLAAGDADAAVTNAPGVATHGLRWLARRPGADIIWAIFGRADPAATD